MAEIRRFGTNYESNIFYSHWTSFHRCAAVNVIESVVINVCGVMFIVAFRLFLIVWWPRPCGRVTFVSSTQHKPRWIIRKRKDLTTAKICEKWRPDTMTIQYQLNSLLGVTIRCIMPLASGQLEPDWSTISFACVLRFVAIDWCKVEHGSRWLFSRKFHCL